MEQIVSSLKGYDNAQYATETYETLNEYGRVAKERSGKVPHGGRAGGKARSFNGDTSLSDALDMCQKGWETEATEALSVADAAIVRMQEERLIPAPEMLWDVAGGEVDIARYLDNEAECMIEFPFAERSRVGETVTIVHQFSTNCGTHPDSIKRYGRLIAALVLAIEQFGLSTEVWCDSSIDGWGRGARLYQRVKIKGAGDMLHTGQLMFGMAHPAMLRQVAFGSMDSGLPADLQKSVGPGTGRGSAVKRNAEEKALYPEGTLFFDDPTWQNDPVIWLVRQLQELNLIPS